MGLFDKLTGGKKEETPQQETPTEGDMYDRIAGSDPSRGAIYVLPGVYPILYVDALKMIKSRKGDDMFIAELEILESLVESRPAGTRMSWVVNMRHDPSPGNVKAFMCELLHAESNDVTAESMKFAVSEKNPCRGRLIRLEASEVETKSGTPFTACIYQKIPEEHQEKADELRKLAGFVPF